MIRSGVMAAILALGLVPTLAAAQPPAEAARPAKPLDPAAVAPQVRPPTPQERTELRTLKTQADAAWDGEKWEELERLARRVLAIEEPTYGSGHPLVALATSQLAQSYAGRRRYAEAEPLNRKALAILVATLGETHPETAGLYGAMAFNLNEAGRYREAEPFYRKALAGYRAAQGETGPDTALSYGDLAGNLNDQGRYAEAEPLYRKALEISRQLHRDTAIAYSGLAANLLDQARYGEAEPLFRQALELDRKQLGEEAADTATDYNNLAGNLQAQGRYAEAEPLFRKALEISRKTLGENDPGTATDYGNVAANMNSQGRHAEAEPLFRTALKIRLAVLGDAHPETGMAYNNLAGDLYEQGRYGEAESLYGSALKIFRTALGETHPETARAYENLAATLTRQSRPAEAERLFRDVLDTRRKVLGDAHPDTAEAYLNLAVFLGRQGRYGEAEPLAARATVLARDVRDVAAGVGVAGAEGSLQRARAGGGDGPEPLRRAYGKYIWIAYGAGSPEAAESAALRARAFVAAQDYTASSAARAMAQAQARAAAGGGPLGELVGRQQVLARQVQALDTQLLGALGGRDAAGSDRLRTEREQALTGLEAADARLAQDFPAYAQLVSPRAVELADLQRRLAPDEGLILIAPVDDDVFSFAVSKDSVAWSRLEGDAAGVSAMAGILRGRMESRALPFDREGAYGLYRDLVAPVEPALARVKRLYVVTSGGLSDLPLGVLMTAPPAPGTLDGDAAMAAATTWLADRYAISILPAVSSLGVAGRDGVQQRVAAGFAGYGAPVLAGTGGGPGRGLGGKPATGGAMARDEAGHALADPKWLRANFQPLAGPEPELRRMARELGAPQSSIHLGPDATEQAVKQDPALAAAGIVAFATHGFLPGQVPGVTEPGLVFTPPADDKPTLLDDGVLTASEAAALRFAADWIILSACNTATSDGSSGAEGLSSLARGFLYAGAGALLASHWSVDDAATSALTTETLALRRAGLTRAQALQGAMRAVRTGHRADGSAVPGWTPRWADPALWAPFTVITNQDR